MKIYLVRHGAAHTKEDDPERHLNDNGLNQCHLAGKALRLLDTRFDLIFSSPRVRARQTAETIAEEVGYPKSKIKITETLVPEASPKDTISYLKDFSNKDSVMLAGHLPLLGNLASELLSKTSHISLYFETGSICQIDVEQPLSNTGIFRWFLTQEQIRYIAQT